MSKRNGQIELKSDPKNARRHQPRNSATVKRSLQEVGAFRSVGADAQGIIRVGNETFRQAQALGYKVKIVKGKPDELVVVQRDDLKGKAAIRAAMLDNLAADSSYADYDAEILAAIAADDELVRALANEDAKIAALLRAQNGNGTEAGDLINLKEQWMILIECANEQEQSQLLQKFIDEGMKCRALTS